MMCKSVIGALALALLGCAAASSSELELPSGARGYEVTCVKDYCRREAKERCPSGYDIAKHEEFFNTATSQLMERWVIACKD